MGLLLALDLGTEGARVGAFAQDGVALGSVHRPYATTYPRAGWAEQDPESWWTAVVDAVRSLLASDACRAAGPVLAVASATTASTVAVLDAEDRPLRPALLWMDARASAQAARTVGLAERHPVLAWSGGSDASEWLLPKAMWLKEHEPETWARAARVVEALDYLTFRLTGRWVGSQMNAVCKYNYDAVGGRFPVELYADLGVADLVERLPAEILPVGAVAGPLESGGGEPVRGHGRSTGRGRRDRRPRLAAVVRGRCGRRLAGVGDVVGPHRRDRRADPRPRRSGVRTRTPSARRGGSSRAARSAVARC